MAIIPARWFSAFLRKAEEKYMHLADLKSYLDADKKLFELYSKPNEWAHKAILNVAASENFRVIVLLLSMHRISGMPSHAPLFKLFFW